MNDRQITFADGTVLQDCDVGYADGSLWIYCALTMRQAAAIFLDEQKTETISYKLAESITTYVGFNDPQVLNVVPGAIRVMLRGQDTSISIRPSYSSAQAVESEREV